MENAPEVVRRYFPDYPEIYARRGWTMFDYIDFDEGRDPVGAQAWAPGWYRFLPRRSMRART